MANWYNGRVLFAALSLAATACSPAPADQDIPQQSEVVENPEPESFVEGNIYFLAYHELGHALVSEFDLPIAGREEDAVDRIAIWMMTPQTDEEEPEYLLQAMHGWFSAASDTPLDEIPWWENHGTDQQRGYQIACLLYGSNSERYKVVADSIDLPVERRESCEWEAEQNDSAWAHLLSPALRSASKETSKEGVTITYNATTEYQDERDYLINIGVLEHLRDLITNDYDFKPGIQLVAEACDEANAFWSADDRRITICYELVSDYQRLMQTPALD
jgi:Putative metallopeptidase